jgi:mitochondrial import receptor subunit TOM20
VSLSLLEDSNRFACTFCSRACLVAHKSQSHSLLFTTESPLPTELAPGLQPPDLLEQRKQAQEKFAAYIKKEGLATPLLVARFIARQVALETNKIIDSVKNTNPEKCDFMDAEGGGYQLADHIERLRFIEVVPPNEEFPLLVDVLKLALPGLEHFVLDERHTVLHGKMAYNAFGVTFGGGRDDKVSTLISCCSPTAMFTRITFWTA